MINRRTFLCGLTLGTLAAPLAAEALEQGKVYRVGRLSVSAVGSASTEALKRGLRELGWTVDQNLLIEIRSAAGDAKRLPALAAELVRMKVDVIVAVGSDSVDAAFRATKDIPIIMAVGSDPERRGWIKSLARPGGNVTGLIGFLPEMGGKRIELVKDLLPKARSVGVMTDVAPGNRSEFEHIEAAGRTLGLGIRQQILVKSAEDLDAAFTLLRKTPVDALYVQSSARVLDGLRSRIAAFGIGAPSRHRGNPIPCRIGFLLAYGASSEGWSYRSAYFVDKILRGAKPADLPIEQPAQFELVINLKTAKALGLTIPQTLLLRADQVIQ